MSFWIISRSMFALIYIKRSFNKRKKNTKLCSRLKIAFFRNKGIQNKMAVSPQIFKKEFSNWMAKLLREYSGCIFFKTRLKYKVPVSA